MTAVEPGRPPDELLPEPEPPAIVNLVVVWFAVLGSIAAWIVHATLIASLAPSGCDHSSSRAAMHLVTVACGLVALASLLLAVRLARRGEAGDPDSVRWLVRRGERFLGLLGVIFGIVNLALIVFEELDVIALAGRACG